MVYIKRIAYLVSLFILILGLAGCNYDVPVSSSASIEGSYETEFFDNSYVHTIDVKISDREWNEILENPVDEETYKVDVIIDGNEVKDVGFSTKGQSSLAISEETEGNQRYSLKIKFGKYVEDQTYMGLDKLAMNAAFQDSTYLREFISYDIFRYLDVPGCLTNFIWVTINGEPYGLFNGIESVDDSYMKRNFGEDWDKGALYKPFVVFYDEAGTRRNYPTLTYTDDNFDSYDYLFNNAETDITDEDKARIIKSIQNLTEKKQLG